MRRDAHHRVVRLDAMVEALPGLADIVAAIDRAVGAAEGWAQRRIEHLRVVRRHAQIAAVAHRRIPPDLDISPMRAAIVAPEKPHAVREEHGPRRRRAAGQRVAVEHPLDLGLADDAALVFFLLGEAQEIGRAVLPALAAVAALHRAVRLDAAIEIVRRIRIDIEPHDAARKTHMHAVRQPGIGQFCPALAAIVAAIDAGRPVPGIDRAPVFRMHRDRPHIGAGLGQREALPMAAVIGAAIGALCRAEKHDVGIVRVHRDRMHLGIARQPIGHRLPGLAADRLAKHAALAALGRFHRPGIHVGCARHAFLPPFGPNFCGDHTPLFGVVTNLRPSLWCGEIWRRGS